MKDYELSQEVKEKYFEAKEKYRKCLMGLNNWFAYTHISNGIFNTKEL